jgi:hypothetical protein
MQVIRFIAPPQPEVLEKILRHCGPWQASAPRAPPDVDGLVHDLDYSVSPCVSSTFLSCSDGPSNTGQTL